VYVFMIAALMFVLPIVSIFSELGASVPLSTALIGKWFVFWAVGIRLLAAGSRQILQPKYTAENILGIKSADSLMLVRELGFANVAVGCVAAASLVAAGWTLPMAVVGALFYGLAGINHLLHAGRNKLQNVAMASDIFIAVVLAVFCIATALAVEP
jgi:hypothetical protein